MEDWAERELFWGWETLPIRTLVPVSHGPSVALVVGRLEVAGGITASFQELSQTGEREGGQSDEGRGLHGRWKKRTTKGPEQELTRQIFDYPPNPQRDEPTKFPTHAVIQGNLEPSRRNYDKILKHLQIAMTGESLPPCLSSSFTCQGEDAARADAPRV